MSEKKAEKLKIDPKTLLIDVLYDIIGSVLYGAGMYTFAVSSNFAPGGVSGLAILVNYITAAKFRSDFALSLSIFRSFLSAFELSQDVLPAVGKDDSYFCRYRGLYYAAPADIHGRADFGCNFRRHTRRRRACIHLYARFFNRRFRLCHSCNSQKESPAFNREHISRC